MTFDKQLSENITLLYGELASWGYDDNDDEYPITYCLVFKFYEHMYEVHFSHTRLQSGDLDPVLSHGDAELFDSFNRKLEDGDFFQEIKQACADICNNE